MLIVGRKVKHSMLRKVSLYTKFFSPCKTNTSFSLANDSLIYLILFSSITEKIFQNAMFRFAAQKSAIYFIIYQNDSL